MKKINILAALILSAFMASCAENPATENSPQEQPQKAGSVFIGTNAIKLADNATRTSLDYTFGENDFKYFWEPGDFMWVYNDWSFLNTDFTQKTQRALFTSSTQYTDEELLLSYSGTSSGAPYAVIFRGELTQSEPNKTAHLGDSGDCGIAKAKKQPDGTYRFTLEHSSAYLCLLPRTPNGLTSTVITKVTIISDNPIIGYSSLQPDGSLSSPVGGTGQDLKKQVITLGTGGQGFPLNNAQTSQATNAVYSVVYPGTHAFTIEYTLKDTQTNVETTITKIIPSQKYDPNTLTPITANLKLRDFKDNKWYIWDADQDYWHGYESEQPTIPQGAPGAVQGPNYPKNNLDPRWSKSSSPGFLIPFDAQTALFKTLPNVNEMFWYAYNGDAHWGSNGEVYSLDGHLQRVQGIWLKKKAKILTDEGLTEDQMKGGYPKVAPKDWRTQSGNFPNAVTPSLDPVPNTTDYFFLPAMGSYYNGWLKPNMWGTDSNLGGFYWSLTGGSWFSFFGAYYLWFRKDAVGVFGTFNEYGMSVRSFE